MQLVMSVAILDEALHHRALYKSMLANVVVFSDLANMVTLLTWLKCKQLYSKGVAITRLTSYFIQH